MLCTGWELSLRGASVRVDFAGRVQDREDAGASFGHDMAVDYSGGAGDGDGGEGGEHGDGSMESFRARETRRLQQNREAAKRFRQKKKNLMNVRAVRVA